MPKPVGRGQHIPATTQPTKGKVEKKAPETLVTSTKKISETVKGKIPTVNHTAQPTPPRTESRTEKKVTAVASNNLKTAKR